MWARPVLFAMVLWPKVLSSHRFDRNTSYMLVANHSSMIDILLMLHLCPNPFVFVGKRELEKIPLFGFFYRRVCILVDRDNAKSRSAVYRGVQRRLKSGLSICIFPEGGVPEKHIVLDRFKDGAFRMAIRHKIPVLAMTFLDCKTQFPWEFFSGHPGRLRVKMHALVETRDLEMEDTPVLREAIRNQIWNTLTESKIH